MTPDQIKEAAIEAGAMAAAITEVNDYGTVAFQGEYHARTWDETPPSTQAAILDKHRVLFRAAIDAYEKAMWRPIEEAPPHTPILTNCKHGLIEGEYQPEPDGTVEAYYWRGMSWYATHFRPLPNPPAQ